MPSITLYIYLWYEVMPVALFLFCFNYSVKRYPPHILTTNLTLKIVTILTFKIVILVGANQWGTNLVLEIFKSLKVLHSN